MNEIAKILHAANFAAKKHSGQKRKNSEPYINHPIEVAFLLTVYGETDDAEIIAAALLHDVFEHCGVSYKEISLNFGKEIAGLVLELSDDKSLPEDERRKMQTIAARSLSKNAKIIRLADKISNLNELITLPLAENRSALSRYADWVEEILPALSGICGQLESALIKTLEEARRKLKNG